MQELELTDELLGELETEKTTGHGGGMLTLFCC